MSKLVRSPLRGVGVRLGDGQGEYRLEAQEERSQIANTFSVSDGTRSRARRGAGRYSPAGSRRPSRRAGRPRGLVGSAQVEEEASPVPWAGKPRRLGKKETISVGASQNNKKQSCSRYHDCLYWSKKEWDWAIPPTNPIEWDDWAIPRKKASEKGCHRDGDETSGCHSSEEDVHFCTARPSRDPRISRSSSRAVSSTEIAARIRLYDRWFSLKPQTPHEWWTTQPRRRSWLRSWLRSPQRSRLRRASWWFGSTSPGSRATPSTSSADSRWRNSLLVARRRGSAAVRWAPHAFDTHATSHHITSHPGCFETTHDEASAAAAAAALVTPRRAKSPAQRAALPPPRLLESRNMCRARPFVPRCLGD